MAKKTHEEFVSQVFDRVGNEYTVMSKYEMARNPVSMRHNNDSCGNHEYPVSPDSFLRGRRCPECFGTKKSDTSKFSLRISKIVGEEYSVVGEYKKAIEPVLMRHNNDSCRNHEFPMRPNDFIHGGQRCPKCGHESRKNKLRKRFDDVRKEVFELVGNEYSILDVLPYKNSKEKVVFKHEDHIFSMSISDFIYNGSRCPECFGTPKKTTEKFISEVKNLEGEDYTVIGEYIRATHPVKMRHNSPDCNFHEWDVRPNTFLGSENRRGTRCPKCNNSKGELKVRQFLDSHGLTYEKEYIYEGLVGIGNEPLRFDFAVFLGDRTILIEYNGEFHYHVRTTQKVFEIQQKHDNRKKDFCAKNNIQLITIPYWDFNNIEEILEFELLGLLTV